MAVEVEEALRLIYKNVKKKSAKVLPIEEVLGSVLAQDIVASHNLPPYDNSAMDGYAVKVSDAGNCMKVNHTIFAGDNSNEELSNSVAIKIMTGAKIPKGCELIVPMEDTTKCENGVVLPEKLVASRHVRLCGEDIKIGTKLLQDGEKLQAHHVALLASQGISHVKVYRKPRIAIFASGSELKMHFESVESYQLYNTNALSFFARSLELGCEVDFIGTANDTLEDIKDYIKSSLDSDLIITSGGASFGDADFTKEAFGAFGIEIIFDYIKIKPGKPTAFGCINDTLVLNLPGNPLAAALNFELFGQSIILALRGESSKYLSSINAKMNNDYKIKKGRRTLIPGNFDGKYFIPCNNFAPGMVLPLAISNSYIMVDENIDFLKSESIVKVISTRFSFNSKEKTDLVSK